jgi:transmembrane sensor
MEQGFEIEELISKFLAGEATPEEAMRLEDWKTESPSNKKIYEESEKAFYLISDKTPQNDFSSAEAWVKVKPQLNNTQSKSNKRFITNFLKIAAIVTIALTVTKLFFQQTPGKGMDETIYQASNAERNVRLKDGSSVILSRNTSITEYKSNGVRKIKLKGEANFTVKHNEKVPFVIDAGNDLFIKDIGTQFTVNNSSDTVFVEVQEGVVEFYGKRKFRTTLHAGQKAYYIKSKEKFVKETIVSPVSLNFNFVESTLKEVVQDLNKSYGIAITIKNKALENCTITIQFEDENIEMILTIITETLGLKYQKINGEYQISGERCTL